MTALTASTRTKNDHTTDHQHHQQQHHQQAEDNQRRNLLVRQPAKLVVPLLLWTTTASTSTTFPSAAHALVKGNAPPPPKTKVTSEAAAGRTKCTNVEECQEQAERKAEEERLEAATTAVPVSSTAQGTRYRDLVVGTGPPARFGDEITTYYKVLKLGKRSYDGISGEGTVVFSCGYGLEDDEVRARDKVFRTVLGARGNVPALNDAVAAGMCVGGIRRFTVAPDRGWRKPGRACDGGPGGSGQGGDLKTDYVVVPTATMVATEACFDTTKQPFPVSYAEQRRMAQRFDQSLIMEVELVHVAPGDSSLL